MAKYNIRQTTQSGKIVSSTGDNQHITIHQTIICDEMPTLPIQPTMHDPGQDIIQVVGRGAKVTINGRRVQ